MSLKLLPLFAVIISLLTVTAQAEEVKSLSGISIIGNKDAPKSLYIVPWRSAELGMESDLNSSLLNEGLHPIDKDVFLRELDFYQISKSK
ncbi:MAG: hypothetical protein OEY29_04455 [Gammaproteobacteria bacterium]|nr:hypothetical protein [Gammaproteobacteria bacterium]